MSTLALIHSPLVTSTTWKYLAPALEQIGYPVAIAHLHDSPDSPDPWWQQHIASAVQSLTPLSAPYILVGHSGAGALLPLIAQQLPAPPVGYLFVDAGILWEPASRLEMIQAEGTAWASEFETHLRSGGVFPTWTDEQLQDILPNTEIRKEVIDSLRPKPLSFLTEELPVPIGWDQVPCGYLQLSASYQSYATAAQAKGWIVEQIDSHHFAMLTNPYDVAEALMRIINLISK